MKSEKNPIFENKMDITRISDFSNKHHLYKCKNWVQMKNEKLTVQRKT